MVRLGDWKLIYYHGYEQPYQLFNLRDDPVLLFLLLNSF
jgi:hypothetical protein